MGFFSSEPEYRFNPFVMPGVEGLEDFAGNMGMGTAGNLSKKMLKQMFKGNYSGLIGGLLDPIRTRSATNLREALRAGSMGANALTYGWQPALMRGMEDTTRAKFAEQEGLALGEAIPQLFGNLMGGYQSALNSKRGSQLGALEAALRGRIGGSQSYMEPSTWDKIVGFGQGLGSLAGLI